MMRSRKIRTPGNRNRPQSLSRNTSSLNCSSCGALLHGMKRMGTAKLANSSISKKSVSRKFGGSMCPACSKDVLREKARTA
jgi:ribosomal protein L34E